MKHWLLPILIIVVIGLWGTSGYILYDNVNRGVIGDMFGAVNSLFSGLAFAGLIYTIFLQKNELSLQRKELELTRLELRGQRETMQAHNVQISLQNFEGTFFQMLRLHNELLNSIDTVTGGGDSSVKVFAGRDCFQRAWRRYRKSFYKNAKQEGKNQRLEQINTVYSEFWKLYESEFGHYFRSLYNIIKFVHDSNIENKKQYTNIVRAQLSGQELIILMYNCIYYSNLKFKPLIETYALLKHLPSSAIPSQVEIEAYSADAYGGNYPQCSQE